MSYNHFRITEFTIKNYRGARNIRLNRLQQFVILVGPNACGKSSVLEALGNIYGDSQDKNFTDQFNMEVFYEYDTDNKLVINTESFKGPGDHQNKNVNGIYRGPRYRDILKPNLERDQAIKNSQAPFKESRFILDELSKCALQCRDENDSEESKRSKNKWSKYAKVVQELLGKELKSLFRYDKSNKIKLLLNDISWDENYLSDGEINLLQILFQALVNDNENELPSVLFIDEPELHLHPDNQLKLIDSLKNLVGEKTQIFIATHSPYILSCFDRSKIRYIYPPSSEDDLQDVKEGVEVITSGLVDLMGGKDAVLSQLALFNFADWGITYNFLKQCFLDSSPIAALKQCDEQGIMLSSVLPSDNFTLLDFGCGNGRIPLFFLTERKEIAQRMSYTGYDINLNQEKINALNGNFPKDFLSCSFKDTKSLKDDEKFDIILCCNTLHEIASYDALDEISKLWKKHLNAGGKIIIIEHSEFRVGEFDFVMFGPEELEILFGKGGFHYSQDRQDVFCMYWDSEKFKLPNEVTYKQALEMVKKRAVNKLTEIEEMKKECKEDSKKLARESRKYGFYLALYANATRRLEQTELKPQD